jgi:hypothetical protein
VSSWTLGITGCLYLATAADFLLKKNPWMALAFFAYALANVGFIGATR